MNTRVRPGAEGQRTGSSARKGGSTGGTGSIPEGREHRLVVGERDQVAPLPLGVVAGHVVRADHGDLGRGASPAEHVDLAVHLAPGAAAALLAQDRERTVPRVLAQCPLQLALRVVDGVVVEDQSHVDPAPVGADQVVGGAQVGEREHRDPDDRPAWARVDGPVDVGEEAVLQRPPADRVVEQRARLGGVAVRGPRGSRYGDRCRGRGHCRGGGRGGLRHGRGHHGPGQAGRQSCGQHREATRKARGVRHGHGSFTEARTLGPGRISNHF